MSWGRVARIYLVLAVLGAWAVLVARPQDNIDPKNLPPPVEESLLQAEPSAIEALTFRRGPQEVHAVGRDGRWQVLRPAEADVPSDLLAALVGTLTAGQASEVMTTAAEAELAAYGLVEPSAEIEVSIRERDPPVRVLLGALNPTGTAVYAKRGDRDAIFLIGLNAYYYIDLVFAGLRPTG